MFCNNLGGIYENALAQEFNAHGFQTYFYNSHKNGELDFLIEIGAYYIHVIAVPYKFHSDDFDR